jgi:hypothetical protein
LKHPGKAHPTGCFSGVSFFAWLPVCSENRGVV